MSQDEAVVLTNAHPAELDHLTYAELSKLLRNLGRLRRELTFVSQDITRLTQYGKSIVYLLDFSELHALLWPEGSISQYRHIVNYLLQNTSLVFTLPPGAIRELLFKLEVEVSKQSDRRRALDSLFSKPFVQAFMQMQGEPKGRDLGAPQGLAAEVLEALVSFRQASVGLEKLARLYDQKRLVHLSSIADVSRTTPNRDVLQDAYIQLSAHRLGKEDVINYIDAYNYAFAYGLNNSFYQENDQFFLLVTSSVRPYEVFENIKWMEDPLFEEEPDNIIRTSLVRHPVQLLYHASLSQYGTHARRVISNATKTLLKLQESWAEVPGYKEWFSKRDKPGSTHVKLPEKQSYRRLVDEFNETYQKLYRPLAEVLASDVALEQNRRLLRGVSINSVVGVYPFDEAQQPGTGREGWTVLTSDYREAIALYDRIVNLAQEHKNRDVGELKRYRKEAVGDLDNRGDVHPVEELSLTWNRNADMGCVEVTAISKSVPQTPYIWVDRYQSFTSLYWPTNVDFAEFLKIARHYVKAVAAWISASAEENEPTKGKLYNGIHFFLDKEVKRLPLEHLEDLSADLILAQCEPQWKLRYVRIGLPYGDLCYDFEPIGSLPQRAGLMTHLKCYSAIADFIQWTHSKYVRRSVWRRVVADSISKDFPS